MTDIPGNGADTPETMIRALGTHLKELGIPHRLDGKEPRLTLEGTTLAIQCSPRTLYGGRLWFYLDGDRASRAIAPADHGHIERTGEVIAAELRMAAASA